MVYVYAVGVQVPYFCCAEGILLLFNSLVILDAGGMHIDFYVSGVGEAYGKRIYLFCGSIMESTGI